MVKGARDCDGGSGSWDRGGSSLEADIDVRIDSKGAGDPLSISIAFWVSRGSLSCPHPGETGRRCREDSVEEGTGGNVYGSAGARPGAVPFRRGLLLGLAAPVISALERPDATLRSASSSSSTRRFSPAISDRIEATFFSTKASTTSLTLSCCCVSVCIRVLDLCT
jgi:hypothetical protein